MSEECCWECSCFILFQACFFIAFHSFEDIDRITMFFVVFYFNFQVENPVSHIALHTHFLKILVQWHRLKKITALVKVTTRNLQFLLIVAAPFDKGGTTPAPAVEKILASVWQRHIHLFWNEWQRDRKMDRDEVMYLYVIYVVRPKHKY